MSIHGQRDETSYKHFRDDNARIDYYKAKHWCNLQNNFTFALWVKGYRTTHTFQAILNGNKRNSNNYQQ
ncbi:hypothetical protein [Prevotella jejuni]